jgi:hypothetical protein
MTTEASVSVRDRVVAYERRLVEGGSVTTGSVEKRVGSDEAAIATGMAHRATNNDAGAAANAGLLGAAEASDVLVKLWPAATGAVSCLEGSDHRVEGFLRQEHVLQDAFAMAAWALRQTDGRLASTPPPAVVLPAAIADHVLAVVQLMHSSMPGVAAELSERLAQDSHTQLYNAERNTASHSGWLIDMWEAAVRMSICIAVGAVAAGLSWAPQNILYTQEGEEAMRHTAMAAQEAVAASQRAGTVLLGGLGDRCNHMPELHSGQPQAPREQWEERLPPKIVRATGGGESGGEWQSVKAHAQGMGLSQDAKANEVEAGACCCEREGWQGQAWKQAREAARERSCEASTHIRLMCGASAWRWEDRVCFWRLQAEHNELGVEFAAARRGKRRNPGRMLLGGPRLVAQLCHNAHAALAARGAAGGPLAAVSEPWLPRQGG